MPSGFCRLWFISSHWFKVRFPTFFGKKILFNYLLFIWKVFSTLRSCIKILSHCFIKICILLMMKKLLSLTETNIRVVWNEFSQALHGQHFLLLLETVLFSLPGEKDLLLLMLPSNDRNHHVFSLSPLTLFRCVATVYESRVTARLPWSHVCHHRELGGAAVPGQKSSAFLPKVTPRVGPQRQLQKMRYTTSYSYKPLASSPLHPTGNLTPLAPGFNFKPKR